jgi:hypothetical protein
MHHLGISDDVLRSYLDHGDSVLLAILIHLIRHFVHNSLEDRWYMLSESHNGRPQLDFDVQNTLPGLQHEFCDLWNEIVLQSRDRTNYTLSNNLWRFRTIYDALHQGSTLNDEHQAPVCSIPAHRLGFTSTLTKVDGDRPETARAAISTPPLYHHDHVPSVITPVYEYDVPLSLTPNLDHATQRSVDEQSHNGVADDVTPVASSFRLAPLDNDRISDDTATDSIQRATVPSAISYMVNAGSRSTSSLGIVW